MRDDILSAINAERQRQTDKWGGMHGWGQGDCSSDCVLPSTKSMVLSEECGEVARAVLDFNTDALRAELVQVAAVAVAWLESFEVVE